MVFEERLDQEEQENSGSKIKRQPGICLKEKEPVEQFKDQEFKETAALLQKKNIL